MDPRREQRVFERVLSLAERPRDNALRSRSQAKARHDLPVGAVPRRPRAPFERRKLPSREEVAWRATMAACSDAVLLSDADGAGLLGALLQGTRRAAARMKPVRARSRRRPGGPAANPLQRLLAAEELEAPQSPGEIFEPVTAARIGAKTRCAASRRDTRKGP